jgi:amino acid adenylation domain-containing protein
MRQNDIRLLFLAAAERFSEAVAIEGEDDGKSISYGELERRSNRLARYLAANGTGPGVPIAILSEDTTNVVTAMLAVLKAGGAFVPLDPRLPPARVGAMLNLVEPPILLTDDAIALARLEQRNMALVPLGTDRNFAEQAPLWRLAEGDWQAQTDDTFAVPLDPDAFCYVYFTSGSTGEPKGIAGRLNGIDHFIRWEIKTFGVEPGMRVSQLTTPSFDAFLRDVFTPLCSGGTVCVPSDRTKVLTPAGLSAWLAARRVNLVHCVPTVFRLLLNSGLDGASLPDLRWVLLAGEALMPSDVERWTGLFGERIRLANLYGPSETTMIKFCHLVTADDAKRRSVPIGKPIAGARALVVDARNRPCAQATIGEILIRTPYRALGYYKRPDLTAEVFVPNPFATDDLNDIVYRTGDLGRVLEDGTFELIGRRDQQVKIRGVRVELGEIEGALRALPQVADAAVVARDDATGTKALVAYFVPKADVSSSALRARLAEALPEAMIPQAFVALRELPRTITGKVDRKALPEPALCAERPDHIAYRTQTEEILVGLWSQLLSVERIGVEDNFFDLGGHSILAMQMLARIKEAFRVEIAVATLFDAPSLDALAAAVDAAMGAVRQADERIEIVDRGRCWPLSFAQQRLWFLEQLAPSSAAYHTPAAIRIEGKLDIEHFEAALNAVLTRQESLRTGFGMQDGEAFQFVAPKVSLALTRRDLSGLDPEAAKVEIARITAEEVARPFDLATPPLMRALLLELGREDRILLFVMHHLVFDAWSIGILCGDIAEAYRGRAPLKPLPLGYLDYAQWQRRVQQPRLEERMETWRVQFADVAPLRLPSDYPRPPVPSFRGERHGFILDRTTSEAVRGFARSRRATLFMVLLAAFKALLQRYSGQSDIAVGTPIANRSQRVMEDVVGFFANTLVLRTDLSGEPSFAELLARVRRTTLDAYAHQDLPFDQLVKRVQPERDLARQPLFQVMFAFQNAPAPPVELPDLVLSEYDPGSGMARFDLTFELYETDGRIAGHVDYALDLFEAPTVKRLIVHYAKLLAEAVADPHRPISTLPILPEEERRALLAPPRGLSEDPRHALCLHEVFARQAAETRDAVALVYRGKRMSYGELEAQSNRLAHHLRGLEVGPENRVALFLGNSAQSVVGILGVLKAGGAYVPLDVSLPADRLAFMLADAGVKLVVTLRELMGRLPAGHPQTVCLDEDAEVIARQPATMPASGAVPANAAYIIYTSGSTGRPKGVVVEHRNVVRLFLATEAAFVPKPSDVWTLFHSYAFDFSVWEIWGALLYGGRLVVVPYWQTRSPDALYDLLTEEGVTVLSQTPSAFWQFAQACEANGAPCPPSLRLVIFGGEALDFRRLRRWFERCGDARPQLVNMYGITETTVHVTCRPIVRADTAGTALSVIGPPLPDLSLYVLDQQGEPAPYGVAGELHVGGMGVSRGYLNRPALTAERFIADPFGVPGSRLYRTGDLARRRPDGEIEYLGRIDHQVKIYGFRIELAEIEAVLSEYPVLGDAVAMLREDVPGEPRLVAYVTWQPGRTVLIEDLRRFAAERLPEYMIPAVIVVLDQMPLTRNGKINRNSLPPPPTERPDLASEFIAPRSERERVLAAIWAKVLGLTSVGVRDNFFVLGGDSIRSIQVCAGAREQGIDISVQQLFRLQTIDALLRATGEEGEAHTASGGGAFTLIGATDLALLPEDAEDAYPLSTLQLGMLYHSDLDEEAATYHDVFTYRLRAPLSEEALRQSLDAIAARHHILRTSFDLTRYSEPLQIVHRRALADVTVEDLTGLSAVAQDAAVTQWIGTQQRRRRDWRKPPLFEIALHRLAEDRLQFTLSFHHAILDGWSVASFLTELFREYFPRQQGRTPPPLTAPGLNYRQFVALERQTIAQKTARNYWLRRLAGSTFTALPRWPERGEGVATRQVLLAKPVSEGLKRAARAAAVPLKSVLLAAHARVLALLTGSSEIVSGMVTHTRLEEVDGERVLGLFLNTLPVRLNLEGGRWSDLLKRAFEAEVELLPHRRYPLALIQRERGGEPLFETVFNFTHYHVYEKLGEVSDAQVIDGRIYEETNYPLTANFSVDPQSDEVRLSLLCNGAVLGGADRLDALASYYAAALEDLALHPEERHDAAALMTQEEAAARLAAGQGPKSAAETKPVHMLVAEQARRTPETVAVEDGREALSYAELEKRANRLAARLVREKVGPETLVALCLPRTADLVVGMLAVLKAGGAYLPLDPDYPPEQLRYMMADAGRPLLLSHRSLPTVGLSDRILYADDPHQDDMTEVRASIDPRNAAYVIYTSGSTGRPKGVMVPHSALSNFMVAMRGALGLAAHDRLLAVTGLPFDIAALELLLPLLSGACLVVADRETVQDPTRLAARIETARASVMQATPTLWRSLIESGWRAGAQLKLLCGGEALDRRLAERLTADGARLFNMYGPTETTIWSTVHPVTRTAQAVPLGRAILNTQLYVLDRHMRLVPQGVPGELYVGGAGVARGYLGRPGVTAERFVPDPFGGEAGARLYRTGDLARWLPGDDLEFLGRTDHQVKIRGHRVELGEVEIALAAHPSVGRCVATAKMRDSEPVLAAYFTSPYSTPPAPSALRRWLIEKLPAHMVPAELIQLDVLPLTPNGKIDRQALAKFAAAASAASHTGQTPPRDRLELELAQLWEEVLGTHPVGVRDHFGQDLGGHSLQAVRLAARIRERFDPAFGLTKLLQDATVERVAARLRQRLERAWTPLVPLQPAGEKRALFCVHPAVGNVLCYLALARRLGRDRPFYGLQAPEADGVAMAVENIEELAALYVSALRNKQPEGAYHLAGHSYGGLVAFEMAQQLHAHGEEVAVLALIDTILPDGAVSGTAPRPPTPRGDTQWLAATARTLERYLGRSFGDTVQALAHLPYEHGMEVLLDLLLREDVMPASGARTLLEAMLAAQRASEDIASRYRPRRYDGALTLIRAETLHPEDAARIPAALIEDPALGWNAFADARVVTVKGDHLSMLAEPQVAQLAQALRAALDVETERGEADTAVLRAVGD